jgi:glutamine amidotransferase
MGGYGRTMIAVLDYGMGNLRSVEKAVQRVGAETLRTADADAARDAAGLILPGVGAFPRAMQRIGELRLDELIRDRAAAGTPVLGICLGLQLLFDSSTEGEGAKGLGLLPGPVEPLVAGELKVPHIGWSPVRWEKDSTLTQGVDSETPFYFVHSLTPMPAERSDLLGSADYGASFACAAERDNVYGVQFHPEKSSAAGLRLLENFARICSSVGATA